MAKQMLFLLDWYPTPTNNGCVFAKHLICAIADRGYECVVIAPRAILPQAFQNENKVSYVRTEQTEQGNTIQIFTPFYLHLTSRKQTMTLSMNNHFNAVMQVIRKEHLHPELVYGHFLYQCGLTAARVGETLGIPSWCACGENALRLQQGSQPYATGLEHCGWREIIDKLTGVITVSSNNQDLLLKNGFLSPEKRLGVFPNGINGDLFRVMDRGECRRELGFPENAFIVAFTGALTANKGADRLNEALKKFSDVYAVFLGQGPVEPDCERILFCGVVSNEKVPVYLNAADVFVLPTRGEGCSNAIVEALACGLPVISSVLPFNDDILSHENSLRVDVENVSAIRNAICCLKENRDLRARMSQAAAETGRQLDIRLRAERILKFMEF